MSFRKFKKRDNGMETIPFMTEQDTQECAAFLLTLKHRSVTPEPSLEEENYGTSPRLESFPSNVQPPLFEPFYLEDSDGDTGSKAPPLEEEPDEERSVESFINETSLVTMEDRDLVPDSLFVAMAQMKPCQLTDADRVGCYKDREIGFTGMCCKHCGGQPGFGKYFPATVRSLAQTTTSQTILKHVSQKCRFCPQDVRKAVLDLQRQQAIKDAKNTGRPRYGSRKVFFQRIWGRLHDEELPERPMPMPAHRVRADSYDGSVLSRSDLSEEEEMHKPVPRKRQRYGGLPTKKKRKKVTHSLPRSPKHSRMYYLED